MTRSAFAGLLVIAGGCSATAGVCLLLGLGAALIFGGVLIVIAGLVLARAQPEGGEGDG